MKNRLFTVLLTAAVFGLGSAVNAAEISDAEAMKAISAVVLPAMEKNQIPGMAVALVLGEKTYVFNYGVSDVEKQTPVTDETIFEIGSISKTFTATLATHAEATGKLKLTDTAASYLPELGGTDFRNLQLFHLGTHTLGGIPLQVPDEVQTREQLLEYFRTWKPAFRAGTMRTYANPSIGALGWITAKSLGQDFSTAMTQAIFQPLGLTSTYLSVPAQKMSSYAWGYNKDKKPVRVNPGMLDSEAYGIKTTASDLSTFLKANMGMLPLDSMLQAALNNTRKRYFSVGQMTQGLIWEEYAMPVDLPTLQEGNAPKLILNPTPVSAKVPAATPESNVWVNKTGATNGFGAYVAFVPEERFGVVLLANKNYPNAERVEIAHKIHSNLAGRQ
ncbi:class C beta-lactamase [Thauera sp. WB-2]|uniref:class C beta-lactamase n=1 Tax=Thauera sp. WB-2 TaxID=2897772 RepID=UPI0022DE8CB0|nr:class C beta-lactamase [Thauera sp. WB-2]WBL64562.1 beta-lactamase [Thauera sp. WB-2]